MKKKIMIALCSLAFVTLGTSVAMAAQSNVNGNGDNTSKAEKPLDITRVLRNDNGCTFEANAGTPAEANKEDFGVSVTANSKNSKFSYNGIVDLSTKETFLGFMFTPTQQGSNETDSFVVTLTDIYDENKYLKMEFMAGTNWGYPESTWIRFSESGKYNGIGSSYLANAGDGTGEYHYLYNPVNAPDYAFGPSSFGSIISASYHGKVGENRYVPSYFYYSAEEKAIYANSCYGWAPNRFDKVFDFDNPYLVGSNLFEGFTTNEVYLSVEMAAVSSGSHILLTDFGGVDMSAELPDKVPSVTLDLMGYDRNELPYGAKGETSTYPVFNAMAYSPYDGIFTVEEIFVRYGGENIPVINGRFATKKSGMYTIFYTATSELGYKVSEQIQVLVKDVYAKEVDYAFNEEIPSQAKLGSGKIYLPDGVASGGFGKLKVERTLTLNGEPVKLYTEGTVDYFIPENSMETSVYELCYSVTDITGRTVDFKKDISVIVSDKPVLSNVYVPKAIRADYATQFAKATAVYYKNGQAIDAPVKVRVNGEVLAESLTYTPTAEGELTVEYIAYNPDFPTDEGKAFIRTEKVSTLKLVRTSEEFFGSYFLKENAVLSEAGDSYIYFSRIDSAKPARLTYANALAAMDFSIKFDVNKENAASNVRLILEDSQNANVSVVFEIRNEGGFAVLYINGVKQKQIAGSFESQTTQQLCVQYSNYDYSVRDFTGTVVGKVTHTAKGDLFKGFDGKLVYATIEADGNDKNLGVYIFSINGQMFSNGVVDRKAPDIFFEEQIAVSRYCDYGSTIVVSAAKAYDVFSAVESLTVAVTAPNGECLYKGAIDQAYSFTGNQYGTYTIEYVALDTVGRKATINCSVEIGDYVAPEITGTYSFEKGYFIGDTLTLPEITATDNVSEKVKTYYVIITPNGYWKIPSENKYTFTETGYYTICLCAVDEARNVTRIEFEVAVGKEGE